MVEPTPDSQVQPFIFSRDCEQPQLACFLKIFPPRMEGGKLGFWRSQQVDQMLEPPPMATLHASFWCVVAGSGALQES